MRHVTMRVWAGGTGNWLTTSQWVASSGTNTPPFAGDTAVVGGGVAQLLGSDTPADGLFDGVAVTLGAAGSLATLDLVDTVLGHFFSITAGGPAEILATGRDAVDGSITDLVAGSTLTLASTANGGQAGDLVLQRGASLTVGNGASLVFQGAVADQIGFSTGITDAVTDNGAVSIFGATVSIGGAVSGTGGWGLQLGATLALYGSVSAGQTITFDGAGARLTLGDLSGFAAAIAGFAPGDTLDIAGVVATSATYNALAGTLTLGGGTATTINGVAAAAGTLLAASDGTDGTLVRYSGALTQQQYAITAGAQAMNAVGLVKTGTATALTGAGVKIGIISDSFNVNGGANAAAAAGFLPANANGTTAVDIITEGPAGSSDEGQAMAELIHATAPGAQIDFASGSSSEASFASAVAALRQAGCQIIVDDLTYLQTPFFQTAGTVDTAVQAAVAAGVNYFSAAGNFGDAYLQSAFTGTSTIIDRTVSPTPLEANTFGNGTANDDVTIQGGSGTAYLVLQWNAPYTGLSGLGAPDLVTMNLYGGGTRIGTSYQQSDNGVPVTEELLSLPEPATTTTYQLAIYVNPGRVAPSSFKLVLAGLGNGSGPAGTIDDPAAGAGAGDVFGQALVPGVNAVGAVDAGNSAAFGQTPDFTQYYSDTGAVSVLAPDGIATTVSGFSNFLGTSAAAPDAAAVAALLLQDHPNLSNTQVTAALESSATSLGLPASEQGAGLINAAAAVQVADAVSCFCAGTLILTEAGEVPVETLAVGDQVVTASGALEPVVWIGRRSFAGRRLAARRDALPVRVLAGALGGGLPRRDLRLSPCHALLIDGVLIEAGDLVNGASVVREWDVPHVEYFHVELARHDVLLAEGAPAETFVDDGSAGVFDNARDRGLGTVCAPRLRNGYRLELIRQTLSQM